MITKKVSKVIYLKELHLKENFVLIKELKERRWRDLGIAIRP
jgi:hypothetical protein